MGQLNGALASQGPLSDSGARSALTARLASNLYGQANQQVLGGISGFTGGMIRQRRDFQNQLALLKYQKKLQPSGFGQFAGKAIGAGLGFLAGGPVGAGIGAGAGGGWTQANDVYNG